MDEHRFPNARALPLGRVPTHSSMDPLDRHVLSVPPGHATEAFGAELARRILASACRDGGVARAPCVSEIGRADGSCAFLDVDALFVDEASARAFAPSRASGSWRGFGDGPRCGAAALLAELAREAGRFLGDAACELSLCAADPRPTPPAPRGGDVAAGAWKCGMHVVWPRAVLPDRPSQDAWAAAAAAAASAAVPLPTGAAFASWAEAVDGCAGSLRVVGCPKGGAAAPVDLEAPDIYRPVVRVAAGAHRYAPASLLEMDAAALAVWIRATSIGRGWPGRADPLESRARAPPSDDPGCAEPGREAEDELLRAVLGGGDLAAEMERLYGRAPPLAVRRVHRTPDGRGLTFVLSAHGFHSCMNVDPGDGGGTAGEHGLNSAYFVATARLGAAVARRASSSSAAAVVPARLLEDAESARIRRAGASLASRLAGSAAPLPAATSPSVSIELRQKCHSTAEGRPNRRCGGTCRGFAWRVGGVVVCDVPELARELLLPSDRKRARVEEVPAHAGVAASSPSPLPSVPARAADADATDAATTVIAAPTTNRSSRRIAGGTATCATARRLVSLLPGSAPASAPASGRLQDSAVS